MYVLESGQSCQWLKLKVLFESCVLYVGCSFFHRKYTCTHMCIPRLILKKKFALVTRINWSCHLELLKHECFVVFRLWLSCICFAYFELRLNFQYVRFLVQRIVSVIQNLNATCLLFKAISCIKLHIARCCVKRVLTLDPRSLARKFRYSVVL
jgi:hypothetical protein